MTREQYVKIVERQLDKINKEIDLKIIRGEEYLREAREHKMLLKKVRQNGRRSLLSKLFFFLPNSSF